MILLNFLYIGASTLKIKPAVLGATDLKALFASKVYSVFSQIGVLPLRVRVVLVSW